MGSFSSRIDFEDDVEEVVYDGRDVDKSAVLEAWFEKIKWCLTTYFSKKSSYIGGPLNASDYLAERNINLVHNLAHEMGMSTAMEMTSTFLGDAKVICADCDNIDYVSREQSGQKVKCKKCNHYNLVEVASVNVTKRYFREEGIENEEEDADLDITEDSQIMLSILIEISDSHIPKEFAAGILLLTLHYCHGIDIFNDNEPKEE